MKRPTMKLSHIMSKYIWEAYCLFQSLHDENLSLDIISKIRGLVLVLFFQISMFVKR